MRRLGYDYAASYCTAAGQLSAEVIGSSRTLDSVAVKGPLALSAKGVPMRVISAPSATKQRSGTCVVAT